MTIELPFMTSYDPTGTSEGTLDPLGLYLIADQLAVQLVPAVRERMQRVRFLTAMAVGAMVTEGLDDDPQHRDASPYLVWEWLVVEALIRTMGDDPGVWGVPGTLVTRRALDTPGYLDARSYLKTPRIFGFYGVYKRLAVHLGIVDVHLGPGAHAEELVSVWARDAGLGGLTGARDARRRWTDAINRCLREKPPRTKPGWDSRAWTELATAFAPASGKTREKAYLRNLLLAHDEHRFGALPVLWDLQNAFDDEDFREETLHERLAEREPSYRSLLSAIRTYETFARSLQDAFDVLKAEAARPDGQGFDVPEIRLDAEFQSSVKGLHKHFETAHRALSEITNANVSLPNLFTDRFQCFSEPMDAATCALAMCRHHETVQGAKSAAGKRAWFDRIGDNRIYVRHAYRKPRREILPGRYVHDYRGQPIRRFWRDLS